MVTYDFFLGSMDREMRRIHEILSQQGHGTHLYDETLGRGACASSHGAHAFWSVVARGSVPVLVELKVDCDLPTEAIVIDHHDDRAGEPPSLVQVCRLIDHTMTRDDTLIAASDAGWIWGLASIGATHREIAQFLGYAGDDVDRLSIRDILLATERVSHDVIAAADRAVQERRYAGNVPVVEWPHTNKQPITTRLLTEGALQENALIIGAEEIAYYGSPDLIRDLKATFPGGWSGGAGLLPYTDAALRFWVQWDGSPPHNGFWGHYRSEVCFSTVERYIGAHYR